jgi:anthranilate phosphoribosyltransferase
VRFVARLLRRSNHARSPAAQSGENGRVTYDPRTLLKEIARGKNSARDLTREQARELFAAIFAGEIADVALGAILVALRVKGENAAELAGMMDAVASHVRPLRLPQQRRAQAAILPTYNGARKLPNLVPLVALLLAREGVPVLLHGAAQEASRVGTFEILTHLGHPTAASIDEAEESLEKKCLAAVPVGVLAPDLARLVDVRLAIGVRNSGHTIAKLILPQGVDAASACRLVAVTHPDFMTLMREHFASFPANVFLMRGLEGEPVVRLTAPQPIEQVDAEGRLTTHLLGEVEETPRLPQRDAASTARWTRAVIDGEVPVPTAIAKQVALITAHCRAAGAAGRQPLKLVSSR